MRTAERDGICTELPRAFFLFQKMTAKIETIATARLLDNTKTVIVVIVSGNGGSVMMRLFKRSFI
jgi:hypothetical protein